MCGICGVAGRRDPAAVERMAAAMVHRGPDDEGFYHGEEISLGFRRLAIIDVAFGRQPLANEDGAVRVVFNGEIYNHQELRRDLERRGHRLRSHSDGEVIAHLYEEKGTALVEDLNGIFAFGLWDERRQALLLARDHHGVKPLCYRDDGRILVFASEIKALLASGLVERRIDPEAVAQYLIYQAVPPPLSILAGVRQLPPGSFLYRRHGSSEVRSYWRPPREREPLFDHVEEASEAVREGLAAAVRRQMMSERPLGIFLSGGIDSSALVALAAAAHPGRLQTFSVGFRGPGEEIWTELPWAQKVAERFATEHHEIVVDGALVRERLPHLLTAMDQPTVDAMNTYLVALTASERVIVALSGAGGDELFLGYPRDARLLAQWREEGADPGERLLVPDAIGVYDEAGRDRVLAPRWRDQAGALPASPHYFAADVPPDPDRVGDWISRLEQRAYLSFVLLRDIDAVSMAHSLEVRVPFLDPAFAETLARIPWQWKLRDGAGKWILKRALQDLLPAEILQRPKQGFCLPLRLWMRDALAPLLRDTLRAERLRRRGIFEPDEVRLLVERFFAGEDALEEPVWALFVLEAWAEEVLDT